MSMHWKKSFRKIPAHIDIKIEEFGDQSFKVACVKKIPLVAIASGRYRHLGLMLKDGEIVAGPPLIPRSSTGKFSQRNANGWIVIRKDLPKVEKDFDLGERPIYGDWSLGSFHLTQTRLVYQRDDIPAPAHLIATRVLGRETVGEENVIVVFEIPAEIHQGASSFREELFFRLNLLQENTGACDVIATTVTDDELLGRVYVNWELLPPGERDVTLAAIFGTGITADETKRSVIRARYDMLAEHAPEQWIIGTGGFNRYFGAVFKNHVLLENIEYGNALYRFDRSRWKELSKLSRTELLHNHVGEFTRVVHRPGWEASVTALLEDGNS